MASKAESAPELVLRDYQIEGLYSMMEAAKRVERSKARREAADRAACILPTGSGKTILMLAFAREVRRRFGWRTLITVPFRKLIYQTAEALKRWVPELTVSLIGDGHFSLDGDVVIAVQASLVGKKLQHIPREMFELVICDEAHHAAARSYELLLEHFTPAKLILGMTATFIRGDQVSIASDKYFPNVIVWNTVGQLTRAGYLVEAFGYYKYTKISLEEVKVERGNFNERQLSHAVNTEQRNDLAVDAWFEFLEGRPTAAFCVDIAHAKAMADRFNQRGVPAAAVWGDMPADEYQRIMEDYLAGQIWVLPNAKLLTEGWDAPRTSGILMARPVTRTAANVLVPQMFGRALRPHPESGKTHAVIVELRDEPKKKRSKGADDDEMINRSAISEYLKEKEESVIQGRASLQDQASRSNALRASIERRKLLENLTSMEKLEETFSIIDRLRRVSSYAWVPLGTTLYMPFANDSFIEIVEENRCSYEVRVFVDTELSILQITSTRRRALEFADSWVTKNVANKSLILNDSSWRDQKPTSQQLKYLRSLTGLSHRGLDNLTCGQVSDLIKSARALLFTPQSLGTDGESALSIARPFTPHVWQLAQHPL